MQPKEKKIGVYYDYCLRAELYYNGENFRVYYDWLETFYYDFAIFHGTRCNLSAMSTRIDCVLLLLLFFC